MVLLLRNIIYDFAANVVMFGFDLGNWSNCPKTLSANAEVFGFSFYEIRIHRRQLPTWKMFFIQFM